MRRVEDWIDDSDEPAGKRASASDSETNLNSQRE